MVVMFKHLASMLLLLASFSLAAASDWPAWQQFKQNYISEGGRIIDPGSPSKITTSEGQSYGLFFALVADDQPMFERLLAWTENNLAAGDITSRLPAWLWGQNSQNNWDILDPNSASDADILIAYNLLEAGRLWGNRRYLIMGTLLLQRIAKEEVMQIPGLGQMLLPGKIGFNDEETWRLNPSYLPPQLLARFSSIAGPWEEMVQVNQRMWLETAPNGFSPDWVVWQKGKGWQPDTIKPNVGSDDAILVYLWAGMLADDSPQKAELIARFQPMAVITQQQGQPPSTTNSDNGKTNGDGSVGFSAALLPFLASSSAPFNQQTLNLQRLRVQQSPPGADDYYSAILTLFGQGWLQHRYHFNPQGELQPSWYRQR
ncbi:cellulose synthase complex periplasmic endoglucanase BcsZ [Yersinia similis]|uniref:cellulase n=1 Tax=Yersinia similis TaxID=367190 RepID=A0A0T9QPF2_9GAMM|nr:cellulose synthase complex periplasmic endoglucanase BcsZ [Yersinia similis]CFQ67003.1 endo-1%2C4-D-glucanase [Yersinia similis]CNB65074.1 endo-1%2C4-D-glucanase [Yersinia similis]CNF29134.1 endo-1%2C4-D-glucanase [Yersinia similis]CNG08797.1 endo-1%2C4-D-glucanase [Yersinia similis]CNI21866.1 endo-1%2C4-D-glucanase [Yersinia similis]